METGADETGAGQPEGGDDRERLQRLEETYLETIHAVQEHFGDHQPSDEEVRSFLRERMIADGTPPEEADRLLSET